MTLPARDYFTVDLRGLRPALKARATRDGLSESDVLRCALVAALQASGGLDAASTTASAGPARQRTSIAKLSVRLSKAVAQRLDISSRAAGLSRGAYLTRLIDGAPSVMASADRAAGFSALNASASELALLSRDVNHLTQLLNRGSVAAALAYRDRIAGLEGDVRRHLDLSAAVIADLMSDRKGRAWVGNAVPARIGISS